ncbi:hypothetical protein MMC30_004302 [Trapelia coarctata]|nr:hypothetical protein [Trapelia coarctata]
MNGKSKALINLLRGWPNPALLPHAQIKAAAAKALSDANVFVPGLLYGPDAGYEPLREELAEWLTTFYKPERVIGPERICITGGASQNLACILQVYSDPIFTRNVWMVSPTYFKACAIIEDSGFQGRLRSVPEDEQGIDIEFLRKGLQQSERQAALEGNLKPEIKPPRPYSKIYRHLIFAVPTFSNPSSKTMSLARRQQLVRVAREYDALIIADDVYDQLQWLAYEPPTAKLDEAIEPRVVDVDRFLDGGSERPGADGFGNCVSNGSFSKIVGPGCRTGWAEGTLRFTYGLSQTGSSASGGAPSQLTATFMSELLQSGTVQQHILQVLRPAYARRYRIMINAIEDLLLPLGVTIKPPDREVFGGYFLWLSLPDPLKADDLVIRAQREENAIIGGGSLFGVYGDISHVELKDKVRLCFAWEEEDAFREGIERLGRVISRMQKADANGYSTMKRELEDSGQEKFW